MPLYGAVAETVPEGRLKRSDLPFYRRTSDSGLPAVRILHPFFFPIRIILVFFYGKIFGDQPVAKNRDRDEENDIQDGRPDALDEEEEEQGHSQRKDSRAHATLNIPRLSDKNVPGRYPP